MESELTLVIHVGEFGNTNKASGSIPLNQGTILFQLNQILCQHLFLITLPSFSGDMAPARLGGIIGHRY